jgi:DNA-binding NtrC family response regulator
MNGMQMLGEIKKWFPDLPVVIVTAYGDDSPPLRPALGACEFITKPTDFDHSKARLRGSYSTPPTENPPRYPEWPLYTKSR